MWENTAPGIPRIFCAGIGPVQLGVVLVLIISIVLGGKKYTEMIGHMPLAMATIITSPHS